MAVMVRCPNPECRQKYSVAESHLGRLATCRKCGTEFRVEPGSEEQPKDQPADAAQAAGDVWLPKLPKKIGRFEIRARLGAGGFGVVYRAYDPTLEREVALKVPHAGRLQTEKDRLRFLREAKAAAKLRHQNIVPVFEAGVDGEQYYMAAAFIEGQTLQEALEKKSFDFREAVRLVQELAAALYYAHKHRIVHRDVKPANIMLDATGEPLLMDFGLARFEEGLEQLTHDGALLGTPAYMAPEQALGKQEDVSPASDQYGLGVVLYELLCGETPFSGPPALVISHVINQEPPPPRSINPKIPRDLETVCLKAMSKRPGERYGSCADLVADLRRWQTGQSILSRRASTAERLWRWCRRNPAVAALSAALVVVLLVSTMGLWHFSRLVMNRTVENFPGPAAFETVSPEQPEAPKAVVYYVQIEPADARLTVSGEGATVTGAGATRTVTITQPDEHAKVLLVASKKGYKPLEHEIQLTAGGPFDLSLRMDTMPESPPAVEPKETTIDLGNGITMAMVLIPAGEFLMGSPDSDPDGQNGERPQHLVRISKPFYLSKYEVTQEQWEAVMKSNPSRDRGPKNPVSCVSWDDCQAFLQKLNEKFGKGGGKFRLPTEAEWEYACRAGSTARWSFDGGESKLGEHAWYSQNSGGKAHPVGEKRPNAWGFYDMHGNVWEWCADWYDPTYYRKSSQYAPSGKSRVVRGGGFENVPWHHPSAHRGWCPPTNRPRGAGLRPVRTCP